MDLTVLGAAASFAAKGQACSGYLVQEGETAVLFDCGNGAVANLTGVMDPTDLSAVFVSHLHPDHTSDLFCLQAMLRYAPEGPAAPLALFGPGALVETASCVLSDRGAKELKEAFVASALRPRATLEVGEIVVEAYPVEHSGETYALVARSESGTLAYTADTAYGPGVLEAALDADVLLAEATLTQRYEGKTPHLSGAQAGRLAAEAGVGALVLTHLWPTLDRDAILDEARREFGGPVALAHEGMEVHVEGRAAAGE